MKRAICVVLGANGFIGSHLVDKLAARGDLTVHAFDRFSREPQFKVSKRVKVIKGDVGDEASLAWALNGADYIVHSLSATTPFMVDDDPYADIQNLTSSVKIFEASVKAGIKKIVFISSGGAVYGRLTETKEAKETDAPMPISPYGISKLSIEHYLEYFKRKYNIEYVVYRLTNPYGPRQIFKQQQGVIAAFLESILHDRTITLYGDGNMSRDFIYIEDAATMIANTFLLSNKHALYNIGSGNQITLNEILQTFKRIFNKEIPVNHELSPKTFLQKTLVSIERFKQEFGEPVLTPFDEGLLKTTVAANTALPLYNNETDSLLGMEEANA